MPDPDDELVARLRHAAKEDKQAHDPYFDLPLAEEVHLKAEEVPGTVGTPCQAAARRRIETPGLVSYASTEEIHCELPARHSGAHRACFKRSRFTHRWLAFEWSGDHADT